MISQLMNRDYQGRWSSELLGGLAQLPAGTTIESIESINPGEGLEITFIIPGGHAAS